MADDIHPICIARGLTNYGDRAFALYLRRSFIESMGYSSAMLERPVVGIASSGSGFNNCHRAMPELVEAVKRGVLAAGALPIEFPTISLGEVFLNPTYPAEEGAWADHRVVRPASDPIEPVGGLVALFGSLAPGGAILERSAADKNLFEKEGRAVVFTSLEDLSERVDDPGLDIRADDIMVLQNAGPTSGSGMPEAGYLPIPKKLAQQGVKDMVRVSDARMSGTAFGTIVLHVTPEAATGGPLALVRSGDRIRLSVKERRIDLLVDDAELSRRRADLPAPPPRATRGYAKLYQDHVMQADAGCDFDFLRGAPRP